MAAQKQRSLAEKIALFMRFFTGRTDVYGTYNPESGNVRQVKEPVTEKVISDHLRGQQPYGVYLLVKDRTRALAVDFDNDDPLPAREFVDSARHYGISAYIERSKSKGYHLWVFFGDGGALATKARALAFHILEEIQQPGTEVFPKQNVVNGEKSYGNFINAPLNGTLRKKRRTVFIEENGLMQPYPDQWKFLENIECVSEDQLSEIIDANEIRLPDPPECRESNPSISSANLTRTFGLPICAQRMLSEGVSLDQRVACFRLAVHLRKAGLPYDVAVGALRVWIQKNRPENGKGVLKDHEILSQSADGYKERNYRGCGCDERPSCEFCHETCWLYEKVRGKR